MSLAAGFFDMSKMDVYEAIRDLPEPYYDDGDGRVIFCGDCRELLPLVGKVDCLLTDPPYGIGEAAGKNKSRSVLAEARDYGNAAWDGSACEAGISAGRQVARYQVIFGGNYYRLPPSSKWLVWDKQNGKTDFADCELIWTNLGGAVRMIHHQWHGMLRKNKEPRSHPTQKPLDVVRWAIGFLPDGSILDPFMGSGTMLLAAKLTGRQAIGIEIEERYCEIAANRLRQKVLF